MVGMHFMNHFYNVDPYCDTFKIISGATPYTITLTHGFYEDDELAELVRAAI